MKKYFTKSLLLLFISFVCSTAFSQTVQICITVDGVSRAANKQAFMCRQDTVTLGFTNCATAPETVTYKWKNISVAPYTDSLDNIVLAKDTGVWVAYATTATLVEYTDTVHLQYYPLIDVNMDDALLTIQCADYVETLTGTPVGPVVSYQWYMYDVGIATKLNGETSNSYTFKKKRVYYFLEVKDAQGCIAYDTTANQVPQSASLLMDLGPDPAAICEGTNVTLQSILPKAYSEPGMTPDYNWEYGVVNNNGTFTFASGSITSFGVDVPPSVTTNNSTYPNSSPVAGINKYWLKLSRTGFTVCAGRDTVNVTVTPLPVFSYADTTLCVGSSITMNPTITDGNPVTGWSWSPNTGLSATNVKTPVVSGLSSNQTYTVTATNMCGNSNSNVTVIHNPPININATPDTSICMYPSGTANLYAGSSGGTGAHSYTWSPSVGLTSPNTSSTLATPANTTTYTLTVKDAKNCTNTEDVIITRYTPPIAAIESPQVINEDISTTMHASINGSINPLPSAGNDGAIFEWSTSEDPSEIGNTEELHREYGGPDTVFYVIKVKNPAAPGAPGYGCYNTDTIEVRSISNNTLMYVPNIFSPNAMNDENKTIKIYSTNLLEDGFKWLVYNKWGNLAYETTNLSDALYKGWSGEGMPDGVYTYVIVGKFKNGKDVKESKAYKGTFSLVR